MPPKFSKHGRTDHFASADYTPRGHRGPREQTPRHEPRGGRPERQDRRQPRDPNSYENRSRAIDDAFLAPLDSVQLNSLIFSQCVAQVLRKQSGVKTQEDHDAALADHHYEMMSRHLSYIFRHTNLLHRDGSLSLHELINHQGTARKIRASYRDGPKNLQIFDEDEISMRLKDRGNTFRFLMPLAHVICDSDKARAMIGFMSTDDFQPGVTPVPDNWFMTADFGEETRRENQADTLEGVDIASILSVLRVDIPLMFQFAIVHLCQICLSTDTLSTEQTRKIFRLFGVSVCFLVAPAVAGIMFILLSIRLSAP